MTWYRSTLNGLNKLTAIKCCHLCKLPSLDLICITCINELETLDQYSQLCQKCKCIIKPTDSICHACLGDDIYFDNIYCNYVYARPLNQLLHQLKYYKKRKFAKVLGMLLSTQLNKLNADLIIPVPLHKNRYKERGFNQVELLLNDYIKTNHTIPVIPNAMTRIVNTSHQTLVDKEHRLSNLANAFKLNIDIQNKTIILVDDVVTTGSTTNAIAKKFKDCGATRVDIVCLLRAL